MRLQQSDRRSSLVDPAPPRNTLSTGKSEGGTVGRPTFNLAVHQKIRSPIFINPKYAPSMVLGRLMVRKQQPEYVGAPQKRFAWAIGWTLALAMLFLVVINRVIGPINLIICSTCLLLMFFETAFGICIGCKIYNLFGRRQAQLCPGGVCETRTALPIGRAQLAGTVLFFVAMAFIGRGLLSDTRDIEFLQGDTATTTEQAATASNECTPPDWAVAMGHADKWKLHHNCK